MRSSTHTPKHQTLRRLAIGVLMALSIASHSRAEPTISSGFFTTSDGVRLHYLHSGRGPTLVFVPGWTMPAQIWMPQIRHFSRTFHVVALDPRAQGESTVAATGYESERRAQDIKELLDVLQLNRVVLIAWSLGVLESLTYVRLYGTGRLNALVLVDNSVGEEPPPSSDPTFLERLQRDRRATTEQFVRGMYRHPQDEEYYQRITRSALKMPTDAAVALLRSPYPRALWRKILYSVDKPVFYVVTGRFEEQALNLKRNRPEAQVAVFDHAGHALFVDEPERFNRLLERFVDDALASQTPSTGTR